MYRDLHINHLARPPMRLSDGVARRIVGSSSIQNDAGQRKMEAIHAVWRERKAQRLPEMVCKDGKGGRSRGNAHM